MTAQLGSAERPVRIAIIGAGPSGYYAAGALIAQKTVRVSIDIFDRLPAPYGLVRYGVAPDHPKIKSVIRVYEKIAADPRVRFFGHVNVGSDLTHAELRRFYDQVIYSVGSSSDRKLGIAGEDLRGSYSATDFVGWYNGHPDYTDLTFDVDRATHAAVIGNGNVAMDVVRILARSATDLATTDIADHALAALRASRVQTITMLGRRGPAQAAFTNPELREFGEIDDADVSVAPSELELDPLSAEVVKTDSDAAKNVGTLRQFAQQTPHGRARQIVLRFLTSPVEFLGANGHVTGLKLERNALRMNDKGALQAYGTGVYDTIPVDIVFRAVGYHGVPLPGVPFDARSGTIPNQKGRVIDPQTHAPLAGEYVCGWAKRGPTGIIGTNKADASETVQCMLADVATTPPVADADAGPQSFASFIATRNIRVVAFPDWQQLDRIEVSRGESQGRPRVKFTRVADMLAALSPALNMTPAVPLSSVDEPR